MFIACPNCSTRYLVDPVAIGITGRDVRCAKCAHSWFQAPPEEIPLVLGLEEPNPVLRDIPEGSALPVKVEASGAPAWLKFSASAAMVAALLVVAVVFSPAVKASVPGSGAVYSLLGASDTDGLAMADMQFMRTPISKRKEKISLSVKVVNTSEQERTLPTLRVGILQDGKELDSHDIQPNEPVTIKPGEFYLVERSIESWFKSATHVKVQLGNGLDFLARN